MTELIWSFAPWLVFLVVSRFATLEDAVACALVASVVVIGRAALHAHVHLLDIAGLAYFAGLLVVVLATDASSEGDISNYAQAGSHMALTVIALGSILVGRPFTESYARETVPKNLWDTPTFHHTNRIISAAWGLAFALGSISLLIAANTDSRPFLLRIAIPFGALYWAYTFTEKKRQVHDVSPEEATPSVPHG
jgi:hypothetical protein